MKWLIKVSLRSKPCNSLCHFCFSDSDLNGNTRDRESVWGRSGQGFSQSDIRGGKKKIQRQEGDGEEQSVRFVSILWLAMWSQLMWLVSWYGPALFTISLCSFTFRPRSCCCEITWNNRVLAWLDKPNQRQRCMTPEKNTVKGNWGKI